MSRFKVGTLAMIRHPHPMHKDLNGTLCTCVWLVPPGNEDAHPTLKTWKINFEGAPKRDDYGNLTSWGYIPEAYLIPMDPPAEDGLPARGEQREIPSLTP